MVKTLIARPLRRGFCGHRAWLRALVCAAPIFFGQSWAAAAGPLDAPASAAITLISLEKDCFGCPSAERWLLRRDGHASHALLGKLRHRTEDQVRLGVVGREDFEALARFTLAQGFFGMQDIYDRPEARDGAWAVVTIERGAAGAKQVFRREGEAPEALLKIEAEIQALLSRIELRRNHLLEK